MHNGSNGGPLQPFGNMLDHTGYRVLDGPASGEKGSKGCPQPNGDSNGDAGAIVNGSNGENGSNSPIAQPLFKNGARGDVRGRGDWPGDSHETGGRRSGDGRGDGRGDVLGIQNRVGWLDDSGHRVGGEWAGRSADEVAREAVASPGSADAERDDFGHPTRDYIPRFAETGEEEGYRELQTRGGNSASDEWAQVLPLCPRLNRPES